MNPRIVRLLSIGVAGLAIVIGAFFFRSPRTTSRPPTPPAIVPAAPLPGAAPEPPPARSAAPLPEDPALRQWVLAVKNRRREGVESSQTAFLAREEEYRAPLMKMAKEDDDARVRAFTVAVLGRMKSPPPESFFVERLDDASEYPRISALQALEKVGTSACLSKVQSLASSNASDAVQAAAARTVKAVRSR